MTQKNRVGIVLDISKSMDAIRQPTIDLYNSLVNKLKATFPPETEATLIYFGVDHGYEPPRAYWNEPHALPAYGHKYGAVEVKYQNVPLSSIKPLTWHEYVPTGNTPLYDGLAMAIQRMETPDPEMSYAVWLLSDGEENNSWAYPTSNPNKIRQLIVDKQGTDRWTFAVLIHQDYVEKFKRLNAVPVGNIKDWGNIQEAETAAVASVSTYATVRSTGARSAKAVFTSDLSGISKRDLKSLRNITHEVQSWKVDKGMRIDNFINGKTDGAFVPGKNFFQVQKDETMEDDRFEFLVEDKDQPKVFYLADRAFLNMPPTGKFRLKPGNHANLNLYAPSGSNNRNLLAGSRVVVWPNARPIKVKAFDQKPKVSK